MSDSIITTCVSTSLCYVPSSLFSILLKYSSSVFSKRPSSLIPSLPLFSSTTHEIIGEVSISFGDSSFLGITSLNFSNFIFQDKVVHVGEVRKKQNVDILFRLLEPRNVVHLSFPKYLSEGEDEMVFALFYHRKNNEREANIAANENVIQIQQLQENLTNSLTSWCMELETAISTGKRFSPILKSRWSWRKIVGMCTAGDDVDDEMNNHKKSEIIFRSNDPDRKLMTTNIIPLSLTIPIGTVCAASVAAKIGEIRTDGLPFDWILTPSLDRILKFISQILFSNKDEEEVSEVFDLSEENNNHVKECTHVNDTNRYYSIDRSKDKETKATYLFQKQFAFIASTTEAARFERRCKRLKDLFWRRILGENNKEGDDDIEEKHFAFVHIGKPFAHSQNFTVDDELVAPELNRNHREECESENEDAPTATGFLQDDFYRSRRLVTTLQSFAKDLAANCETMKNQTTKKEVTCFFFAFNVTSRCFTEIIDASSSNPMFSFKIVLLHQFIGYSSPSSMWDSIGHVSGRHLPGKHLMIKKVFEGGFL